MNSALAREQLRANRIRDLAASHSRKYEDTSEEERDQLEQEREADYNKYKKASGSHTATGISLAASFYKDIAGSIKGVLPKVAKGLSTSVGGYLQGASSSLNYSKRIVEADKQRGHQKELGGLGRVNQGMNIFKSIMPTAITGNIAKTLMTGAGSPVGLSSMFNPMMFGGMMGLSFITKMMTNRKIQKINVTRKTMLQEQRRYSISGFMEQSIRTLTNKGALQPFEQLSLTLLSRIEANSIFQMLTWQMLEKQRADKEDAENTYQSASNKDIYGDEEIGAVGKTLNNLEDRVNLFNLKYNPLLQLTNFLIGKKLPKNVTDEIEDRLNASTSSTKDYFNKESRLTGIRVEQLRLLDMDANRLTSSGKSYEQKMFSLASGQFEMLRFVGSRIRLLVSGLGINDTSNYNMDYEEGAFGKMITGIKNVMMNIPGINALTNITTGVLSFPMKLKEEILPKLVGGIKKKLFGQKFLDLQDQEFLEKKVGLHKSSDESAKEFMSYGLPNEIKKVVKVGYEQLTVLKNIYDVSQQSYQIQSEGDTHKYNDDQYNIERQNLVWDRVAKRYVTPEQFDKNLQVKIDEMMFEQEQAFSKSILGKSMHMFDMLKGAGNVLYGAGTGQIRNMDDMKASFKRGTGGLKGHYERMQKATGAAKGFNTFTGITDELEEQQGGMIDAERLKQIKTQKRLEAYQLTGSGQDYQFDLESQRADAAQGERKFGKMASSGLSGILSLVLGAAGGGLGGGLLTKLLLGGAGAIAGTLPFFKKEKDFRSDVLSRRDKSKTQRGSDNDDVNSIDELIAESTTSRHSPLNQRATSKKKKTDSSYILELLLGHFTEFTISYDKNIIDEFKIVNDINKNSANILLAINDFKKDSIKSIDKLKKDTIKSIDKVTRTQQNIFSKLVDIDNTFKKSDKDELDILTDMNDYLYWISESNTNLEGKVNKIDQILTRSFGIGADSIPTKLTTIDVSINKIYDLLVEMKKEKADPTKKTKNPPHPKPPGTSDINDINRGVNDIDLSDIIGDGHAQDKKAAAKGGKNLTSALVGERIHKDGSIGGAPEIVTGKFDVIGQEDTKDILSRMGMKVLAEGTKKYTSKQKKNMAERGIDSGEKDEKIGFIESVLKHPKNLINNPVAATILGLTLGAFLPGIGGLGMAASLGMSGLGLGMAGTMDKAKQEKEDSLKDAFESLEDEKAKTIPGYKKQKWKAPKKSFLDKIGMKGVAAAGGLGVSLLGGPLMSLVSGLGGGLLQGLLPSFLFKGAMGGLGLALGPLAPIIGALGALAFTMHRRSKKDKAEKVKELLDKTTHLKQYNFEELAHDDDKVVRLADEQAQLFSLLRSYGMTKSKFKGKGRLLSKVLAGGVLGGMTSGPVGMLLGTVYGGMQELFGAKNIDYTQRDPAYFTRFRDSEFENKFGVMPIAQTLQEGEFDENTGEHVPFSSKQLSDMYKQVKKDRERLESLIAGKLTEDDYFDPEETPEPRAKGGRIKPRKPYLVGEKGPEVRVFDHPGKIISNDVFKEIKSEMSAANIKLDKIIELLGTSGVKINDENPIKITQIKQDGFMSKVMKGLSGTVGLFSASYDTIKDIVKNTFDKTISFIPTTLNKTKEFLSSIFNKELTFFPNMSFDKIKDFFSGFTTPFKFIGEQLSKIPNMLSSAISFLSTSVKTLIQGMMAPFKLIGNAFKDIDLTSVSEGFKKFFSLPGKIFDGIVSGAGKFWDKMTDIPGKISSLFSGLFKTIGDTTSRIYGDITKGVSRLYSDMASFMGSIKTGISSFMSSVTTGMSTVYTDLKVGISKLYTDAKSGVGSFLTAINPMTHIRKITSGVSEWWGGTEGKDRQPGKVGFKQKAIDAVTLKGLRSKLSGMFKSGKTKSNEQQDELDKNVKKQKFSEEDFRSEVIFYLEKIYHRLGKLTEHKEGIISKSMSGLGSLFNKGGPLLKSMLDKSKELGQSAKGKVSSIISSLKEDDMNKDKQMEFDFRDFIKTRLEKLVGNTDELEDLGKAEAKDRKGKDKDSIWSKMLGFLAPMAAALVGLLPGIAVIFSGGKIGTKALASGVSRLGMKAVASGSLIGKGIGAIGSKLGSTKLGGFLASKTDKLYGAAASGLEKVGTSKLGQSFVGKFAKGLGTSLLGKLGIKVGAAGLKSALKKIPIIGALFGIGFGIKRAFSGDFLGAALEVASGVASIFPGIGTGVSLAIDAFLMLRDMKKDKEETKPKESMWNKFKEWIKETTKQAIYHIPFVGGLIKGFFEAKDEINNIESENGEDLSIWDQFKIYVKNMAMGSVKSIPFVGNWLADKMFGDSKTKEKPLDFAKEATAVGKLSKFDDPEQEEKIKAALQRKKDRLAAQQQSGQTTPELTEQNIDKKLPGIPNITDIKKQTEVAQKENEQPSGQQSSHKKGTFVFSNANKGLNPDTAMASKAGQYNQDKITQAINEKGSTATAAISGSLQGKTMSGMLNSAKDLASSAGSSISSGLDAIMKQEGSYDSVNKDDAGKGVSLGKLQWHGPRAKELLQELYKKDPKKFEATMGSDVVKMIQNDKLQWHDNDGVNKVTFNDDQKKGFANLMQDPKMREVQDSQAKRDYNGYIEKGKKLGIKDPKALAYFADVVNQYGESKAAKMVSSLKDKSLDGLHSVMKGTGEYGKRRDSVYAAASNMKDAVFGNSDPITPTGDKKLDAELAAMKERNNKKNSLVGKAGTALAGAKESVFGMSTPIAKTGDAGLDANLETAREGYNKNHSLIGKTGTVLTKAAKTVGTGVMNVMTPNSANASEFPTDGGKVSKFDDPEQEEKVKAALQRKKERLSGLAGSGLTSGQPTQQDQSQQGQAGAKAAGSSKFVWPGDKKIINSPFGKRSGAGKGASTDHKGIDIKGAKGDPIYASMPGTVVSTDSKWGGVVIDHGNGITTRNLHMSGFNVKPGDKVTAGQVIGAVGDKNPKMTNMPAHIHFEVLKNGAKIDPELFIKSADPSFNPQYASGIKESRQLSAKIGKDPSQAITTASAQDTQQAPPDANAGGDATSGFSWGQSARNAFNKMQDQVTESKLVSTISKAIPVNFNSKQRNSGMSLPSIPMPVSVDNKQQERFDNEFSKIDSELDRMINSLFRNVCKSFEGTVLNYAFTNTATQSLF